MEEFNQATADFDRQYELVSQAIQQRNAQQQGGAQKFEQLSRRLDNCFNIMKSRSVSVRGPDKSKVQQILIQRTKMYQELLQQIQQPTLTSVSSPLTNDPLTSAYQKSKVINNYLEDAKRNADEATHTGHVIVNNLKRQNQQMQGIINTNQNIQANAEKSKETLKVIQKKEKMVNIIFYSVSAVLLASNGLAFWIFHHNVPKKQ